MLFNFILINWSVNDAYHHFDLHLSIFNCSTSYLLWPAALPIIGWLASINPISHGTGHGWNRCKLMPLCNGS